MYSIQQAPGGFDTYLLEDKAANSAVRIARERGGLAWSFIADGREIFYVSEETFHDQTKDVHGGCPILFPGCGRFQPGGTYQMKIHGFARDLPWQMAEQNTQDGATLTLFLEANEETRKVYPFAFRLEHTYRLCGNQLSVTQRICNLGDKPLPASLGLHPYFKVDTTLATAEVPSTTYQYQGQDGTFSGTLQMRDTLDHVCGNLNGCEAVLHTGLGYDVRITASDAYRYFVVWSPDGVPFACVEPWTAPPNALNTGTDVVWVEDTWEATMTLSVESAF